MTKIYKNSVKENNLLLESLSGEYQISTKKIVKELRKYSLKSLATEQYLNSLIKMFIDNQNKGVRYSSIVSSISNFIEQEQEKLVKDPHKQKFSLKDKIVIGTFLVIMIGITIFSYIMSRPVKFDAPSNVKIENDVLYYDEVDLATKYLINISTIGGVSICDKILYDNQNKNVGSLDLKKLEQLQNSGTYIIRIQTIENEIMESSEWSEEVTYVVNK